MQQAIKDTLVIGHVSVVPLLLDITEAVDALGPQQVVQGDGEVPGCTVNSRRLLGYRMSHLDESAAAEGPRASTEGGVGAASRRGQTTG